MVSLICNCATVTLYSFITFSLIISIIICICSATTKHFLFIFFGFKFFLFWFLYWFVSPLGVVVYQTRWLSLCNWAHRRSFQIADPRSPIPNPRSLTSWMLLLLSLSCSTMQRRNRGCFYPVCNGETGSIDVIALSLSLSLALGLGFDFLRRSFVVFALHFALASEKQQQQIPPDPFYNYLYFCQLIQVDDAKKSLPTTLTPYSLVVLSPFWLELSSYGQRKLQP